MNTIIGSRGRYARILVEVDITKPLLSKFKLKNKIRIIEYEGIHLVCFKCGIYGHRKEACSSTMNDQVQIGNDNRNGEEDGTTVIRDNTVEKSIEPTQKIGMSMVIRPEVLEGYDP